VAEFLCSFKKEILARKIGVLPTDLGNDAGAVYPLFQPYIAYPHI
jgi:hypothetical protein